METTDAQIFLEELEEGHPIQTADNLLTVIGESIRLLSAAVDEISTRYPNEDICREILVRSRKLSNSLAMCWSDNIPEVTAIEDAAEEIAGGYKDVA